MEQPVSEELKTTPEQIKPVLQTKTYEIGGAKINVSSKEFVPSNKEIPQNEAILFFTGWSAGTAKTLEYLNQRFAEDASKKSILITSRSERALPNYLQKEAQAIRQMIAEKGLKKITLAAHSEGGVKAVDLIDILQKENKDIEISGLILLDPVGLYEQGKAELSSKFGLDTMVSTPLTLTKNLLKDPSLFLKGLQASSDIIFNVAKEMIETKLVGYPNKLLNQVTEMAKANTHYADVKCPVVLIQGARDPVSSPDRIVSKEERIRYVNEAKARADNAREYRESLPKEDKTTPRWPHDPNWVDEINQAVQQTFFPNSPSVHWLVPEKIGHHGLPHFRSDQISKVSLGLLERFWRKKAVSQTPAPALQGETLQS